eukprot:g58690.t1
MPAGKKKKTRKKNARHDPIGLEQHVDSQQVAAAARAPEMDALSTQLHSDKPDQRVLACGALARVIESSSRPDVLCAAILERGLFTRVMTLCFQPRLQDRVAALQVLRNMVLAAGSQLCRRMVDLDLLTPVLSVFDPNTLNLAVDTDRKCVLLRLSFTCLHFLIQKTEIAVESLQRRGDDVLSSWLEVLGPLPCQNGPDMLAEGTQFLLVLSEDNVALSQAIFDRPARLQRLLQLAGPSVPASSGPPRTIPVPPLARIAVSGSLLQLLKGRPDQLARPVQQQVLQAALATLYQGIRVDLSRAAAELLGQEVQAISAFLSQRQLLRAGPTGPTGQAAATGEQKTSMKKLDEAELQKKDEELEKQWEEKTQKLRRAFLDRTDGVQQTLELINNVVAESDGGETGWPKDCQALLTSFAHTVRPFLPRYCGLVWPPRQLKPEAKAQIEALEQKLGVPYGPEVRKLIQSAFRLVRLRALSALANLLSSAPDSALDRKSLEKSSSSSSSSSSFSFSSSSSSSLFQPTGGEVLFGNVLPSDSEKIGFGAFEKDLQVVYSGSLSSLSAVMNELAAHIVKENTHAKQQQGSEGEQGVMQVEEPAALKTDTAGEQGKEEETTTREELVELRQGLIEEAEALLFLLWQTLNAAPALAGKERDLPIVLKTLQVGCLSPSFTSPRSLLSALAVAKILAQCPVYSNDASNKPLCSTLLRLLNYSAISPPSSATAAAISPPSSATAGHPPPVSGAATPAPSQNIKQALSSLEVRAEVADAFMDIYANDRTYTQVLTQLQVLEKLEAFFRGYQSQLQTLSRERALQSDRELAGRLAEVGENLAAFLPYKKKNL